MDDDDEADNGQVQSSSSSSSSFLRQIDEILSKCPDKGVQRGLFSATLGPFVKELASNFLNNPITVSVGVENAGANTIDHLLPCCMSCRMANSFPSSRPTNINF